MASQDQVIALNQENPEWSAGAIAEHLGCSREYVQATGVRNGLRFARVRKWTKQDIETARRLFEEKAPHEEFIRLLGRTRNGCFAKMDRLRQLSVRRQGVIPPVQSAPTIPPEVIEDAIRRASAPRSLTAILMGDPEVNRVRL